VGFWSFFSHVKVVGERTMPYFSMFFDPKKVPLFLKNQKVDFYRVIEVGE
jgi:hypothetical protein